MSKSTAVKGLVVILLVTIISYSVWENPQTEIGIKPVKQRLLAYQTTTTRTNNVIKYCPVGVDRNSLVTASDLSTAKNNMNAVSTQLGIDGNSMINKVARSDLGGAASMISSNVVNIAIFIGVFLVPFVIFMWVWPFLCCCCCCPSCCPSKCCQKAEEEPYSKCELYWPAITLIIALLLVISTSIYGFINASSVGATFNNMSCSLAIFTDDLLNGNTTTNGSSFFTGLVAFKSSLTDLGGNLTTVIKPQLLDLSNTAAGTTYGYVQDITTVQNTYVKIIPDGVGATNMNLNYDTPIDSGVPTPGALASSFSAILGKWSTSNTLMFNLYSSIEYARLLMEGIKNNSNSFDADIGTINGQIIPIKDKIQGLITDIQSMDSGLGNFLSMLSMPGTYGNMGMQAFYGFLIGFSFFALIGALLTVCCDKAGCRHLMYFSCLFLFFGAILGFMVSIIFSFMVPLFTWTCSYLNVAVGSSTGFQDNFGAFLSNSTINQITVCMPYGDGNIINTVAGTAANGLNNLTSVINSLKTFDNVTLESYISGNLSALTNSANAYANGDISDLDSSNNAILAGFSDPTGWTGCNGVFSTDSWVPSNNQDSSYSTAISCKVSTGTTGSFSNCIPALTTASSCSGCMDTTQLLTMETAGTLTSNLQTRYGGAGCNFITPLSNAWTNYFNKKYTTLGKPSATGASGASTVLQRIAVATPKINTVAANTVFTSINQFRNALNTISTGLSGIASLTDPTYGMLAGLNCNLFGQDFVTFQNVICGSFYNNMYIIRLTFGIASWGILFSMCCIVCTGVRHYKQVDKLRKITGVNIKNQQSSNHINVKQ